jgi:hypothetical protein
MEAILSSFCFSSKNKRFCGEYFHRMPPVSFERGVSHFCPDYSSIFLCDSFYVDELSLVEIRKDANFKEHSLFLDALESSGRLKIIDFESIVAPYDGMIKSSVHHDMRDITAWLAPFTEAVGLWSQFQRVIMDSWRERRDSRPNRSDSPSSHILWVIETGMVNGLDWRLISNLENWKKDLDPEYRQFTREIVSGYLEHVAANLCLSDSLGAVIYDWSDIGPIYQKKFSTSLRVENEMASQSQDQFHKLFEIMFPDFEPKSVKDLVKAFEDPRIESLRDLIKNAVAGKISFDQEFANRTLREVLKGEIKLSKIKNIMGWAVKPLSFVPWAGNLAETGAQEVAKKFLEKRIRQDHGWFFLLSDITKHW